VFLQGSPSRQRIASSGSSLGVPGAGPAIRLLCDRAKLPIGVRGRGTGSSCSTASRLHSGRRLNGSPALGLARPLRVEVAPLLKVLRVRALVQARNRDAFL
jgi:hypothetical protein